MDTFFLDILTPEHRFFQGQVEALTVEAIDGQRTFYAHHAPLITGLAIGQMRLKIEGEWQDAFNSEGFVEVRHEGVLVFVQACEWPHEIDINRAREALARAERNLRERQSRVDYHHSQISVARAMTRLRVSSQHTIEFQQPK